ncbi:hypothetical protein HXX76_008875 [Chlamydomonas incerta]|uniref:N-acetyltransferase domain-containing protein n=1 Tax=Chlamydomonas incerta TaxID=51695 RepID=A0A835T6F6_CHLIN|nr:hypothetical protein HXX76_008875 [Chlamydomonas incerta]|eukprot:KAG2432530.1 hypothetical protein HXX76_008875 [Chlamydomonas incerta]
MFEGRHTKDTCGLPSGGETGLGALQLAAGAILPELARAPAVLPGFWQHCIFSSHGPALHLAAASSPPPAGSGRSCGRGPALPWAAVGLAGGHRAADKGSTTRHVCAGCHQHLTAADLARLEEEQEQAQPPHPHPHPRGPGSVLQCDGCHRCFHGPCHRRWAGAAEQEQRRRARLQAAADRGGVRLEPQQAAEAAAGDWDEEGAWFHDPECKQVRVALLRLCRRGDVWLPEGAAAAVSSSSGGSGGSGGSPLAARTNSTAASPPTAAGATPAASAATPNPSQPPQQRLRMRLYDCGDGGPAAAVGLRRVHGVLRAAGFGYGLADLRQFDLAALLLAEDSGQAVSAAVLDVYGSSFAELYLLATCAAVQRRGYGRALVRQLEASLAASGVRRLLVSVDDDDGANRGLWRTAMGFEPVPDTQLRELAGSWGAFGPAARRGTVFLGRSLLGGNEGEAPGLGGGNGRGQAQGEPGKR